MADYAPYPVPAYNNSNDQGNSGTYIVTYGTNASDATTHSLTSVSAGGLITSAKYTELATAVNAERTRRRVGAMIFTPSATVTASDINTFVGGVNATAYPPNNGFINEFNTLVTWPTVAGYVGSTSVSAGSTITAANINSLISDIQGAAAVCTCNCNYCTCNCNYCTCNCNYSCTCNCNYSDKRLKENIKYVRTEHGIKLYSFNYIWDRSTSHVGVMAQELLGTKHAAAVSKADNGFYVVDYNKLPVDMIKGD
jgi:hypothetical protein